MFKHIYFITFTLILSLIASDVSAQKEDHQWLFNWSSRDDCSTVEDSILRETCGASILDFNTLPPTFYKNLDITLDISKTNAIICDENGELLLYSNGQSVHQAPFHEPIINGEKINAGQGWNSQVWANENGEWLPSGFRIIGFANIIPIVSNKSNFTILYQNADNWNAQNENTSFELRAATIKKGITDKMEVIYKDSIVNNKIKTPGIITACKHGNGRDWWLLQISKDTVYTYMIDNKGINLKFIQFLPFQMRASVGDAKFNRQGNMFAIYHAYNSSLNGVDLMISKFDRCSGFLINPKLDKISGERLLISPGLEFSANSNYLYISNLDFIYQYDLTKENLFENPLLIASRGIDSCSVEPLNGITNNWGQMQMGPDKKIYIANSDQCVEIHRINYPNKKGLDCDLDVKAIALPTFHMGTMPNLNTYRLGPLDGSPCDTLGLNNEVVSRFWFEPDTLNEKTIQFWDVSFYEPKDYHWDFGDGSTSTEISPIHEYDEDGLYVSCLTVSNDYSEDTSCDTLRLGVVSLTKTPDFSPNINIYPNPVEDITRVVISNYIPNQASFQLFDQQGKLVFKQNVYQESLINLQELNSGIYVFKIIDKNKLLNSGKIVKL